MKKKITQVLSIIVAGSLITTSAVYTDSFNDQKTISPSYYADFCSHLSNQIYREVGSVSISNANLVNSYLANELAGTRFELKEDGTVVAYISDTKWRSIENGVANIIDDKALTDKVVTITKEVVDGACNDLSSQVSDSAQMVVYCDSAIESINAQFGEQSAEFLLQDKAAIETAEIEEIEDSTTNESITIAQRDEQIESLEAMKSEYELKSTNLTAFNCYAGDVNLASYVEDDADYINSLCGELDNTTSTFISDLDAIVNELAESGIDTTQLALVCSSFEESADQSVSDVKFSCDNLLGTNMSGADLEQYMQNECADLEIISSNLSDNSILNGLYETSVISEDVSNTNDLTMDTTTVEYSDDDIEEIKSALSEIQEQLNLFDEKYGNAIADVSAEVNAITSIMQIMGEGGIYEEYMASLNSITSELNEKLGELRTTDSTSSTNAAIDSISELVATYTTNTNETVSNIQNSVDSAISSVKGNTMNMGAFSEYQGYVINLASSSSDAISSLQTSIETEAAERKTADEKLSQSIGTIRSDIMYLIGSKSISNVGSSITAAIGNTSLAGIGDGTISGAISSLNNSLVNKLPYINNSDGDGSASVCVDKYNSDVNGAYLYFKASKYSALLKQFYNGALTFQYTSNSGASWQDLLRFDETNNSAAFSGPIYEQGTALCSKYVTQKGGQVISFTKSGYVKNSYCDGYGINHIGTIAICMEVNRNATWSDCYLGKVGIAPYHLVRTTVVLQDSGLSIPLRIETNGNVYLEIKGVNPGTSGWIYGGITYYYN